MSLGRSMEIAARFGLLGAALAAGSCTADSVSLYVVNNAVPEDDCSVTADGDLHYAEGVLNLEYLGDRSRGYRASLRVQNGLKPRNSELPVQSEPNGMQIYEVEVSVLDRAGGLLTLGEGLPNPYSVAVSGAHMPPAAVGIVGVELISPAYVQRLRELDAATTLGRIQLDVVLRGRTDGQVEVESAPWTWVVELVAVDLFNTAQCVPNEETLCRLGQDGEAEICVPTGS